MQTVDLSTVANGQVPDISVGRLAGPTGQAIIAIGTNGDPLVLDRDAFADGPCIDPWHHLEGCIDCDTPNCVVLATITRYRYDARMVEVDKNPEPADARIDNRLGRRVLAPTQALQGWIECLQSNTAGQDGQDGADGTDGAPGVGLDVKLPKIIDIGWQHRDPMAVLDFLQRFWTPAGTPIPKDTLVASIVDGRPSTPFVIYFNREMRGIDRQSLRLYFEMPGLLPARNGVTFLGMYSFLSHHVYGDIVSIPGPLVTPHTNETSLFAVAFIPRFEWFSALAGLLQLAFDKSALQLELELPTLYIQLKGEFVHGLDNDQYSQDLVLDGDNVGGRVGLNVSRGGIITGGKNPSGNLTQGGRFESWLFLKPSGDSLRDVNVPPVAPEAQLFGLRAEPLRRTHVNLMTAADLEATPGVSRTLARRIVAARREGLFGGVRDFRERAQITDPEFKAIKGHLLIV